MDAARFSGLLDLVYACALDPECWSDGLSAVALATGCRRVAVAILDPDPAEAGAPILWRSDPDDGDGFADGRRLAALLPAASGRIAALPALPGGGATLAAAMRFAAGDADGLVLAETTGEGDDAAALAALALLAPHLARAATLGHRLLGLRRRADRAAALLDCTATAVLLVDARLRLLHVNQAARVLLARRDCLATDSGTVQALDPAADRALASAVASAVRGAGGGRAIAIPRPGGGPVLLQILPGGGPPTLEGRGAFAVVLAVSAAAGGGAACEALAGMCGLTAAETDVLRAIAAGESPAEAAVSLGVGVATVRTHLLRIFAKTGVDGQPGLVRLATALRPV